MQIMPHRPQGIPEWFDENENDLNYILWPSQSRDHQLSTFGDFGPKTRYNSPQPHHQNTMWGNMVNEGWQSIPQRYYLLFFFSFLLPFMYIIVCVCISFCVGINVYP